jgi:hypothetical protein
LFLVLDVHVEQQHTDILIVRVGPHDQPGLTQPNDLNVAHDAIVVSDVVGGDGGDAVYGHWQSRHQRIHDGGCGALTQDAVGRDQLVIPRDHVSLQRGCSFVHFTNERELQCGCCGGVGGLDGAAEALGRGGRVAADDFGVHGGAPWVRGGQHVRMVLDIATHSARGVEDEDCYSLVLVTRARRRGLFEASQKMSDIRTV